MSHPNSSAISARKQWYRLLYVQVLIAVVLGIVIGRLFPEFGKSLKPLGDGFIKLVKMMITPIIFCTVVHGIASMSDLKKLGRIGVKALVYFEVVSTLALIIGLVVVNVFKPGAGFNIDPATLDPKVGRLRAKAHSMDARFLSSTSSRTQLLDAFCNGRSPASAAGVSGLTASPSQPWVSGASRCCAIEYASQILFGIMGIVVRAAPLGAFGAMAFTVGGYGLGALNRLITLMAGFLHNSRAFRLHRARTDCSGQWLLDLSVPGVHHEIDARARDEFVGTALPE